MSRQPSQEERDVTDLDSAPVAVEVLGTPAVQAALASAPAATSRAPRRHAVPGPPAAAPPHVDQAARDAYTSALLDEIAQLEARVLENNEQVRKSKDLQHRLDLLEAQVRKSKEVAALREEQEVLHEEVVVSITVKKRRRDEPSGPSKPCSKW